MIIFKFYEKMFSLNFAQNIDYGHPLELPKCGGSNEYPRSFF